MFEYRLGRASAVFAAALACWVSSPHEAVAAEANGIWTEPATKDLGELTGEEFFENWKIRGWIEGYYVWNYNEPGEGTVDANQAASIVKGDDISIEARTFDVRHARPTMTLMEIELEKVPQLSGWLDPAAFGFKIDVNYGETPDIIHDSILGGLGNDILNDTDRWLQHYSIGYVAPIGRGLRIDFGKLVTHIGGETIETIKNNNFSHGYLYTYAIPFQQTGFRLNYGWTDTFYTEFYVLQGWNSTWDDNNNGKTYGPSFGWAPHPRVATYFSYLTGPEQRNDTDNKRHLFDFGINFNPVDPLNIFVSADYGYEENAVATTTGAKSATWVGAFTLLRYKLTSSFEPALRLEFLNDPDGFASGVTQDLFGVTLTLNYRVDLPKGAHLLLRPEYRWDHSSNRFFTEGNDFREDNNQHTLGLGVVAYY